MVLDFLTVLEASTFDTLTTQKCQISPTVERTVKETEADTEMIDEIRTDKGLAIDNWTIETKAQFTKTFNQGSTNPLDISSSSLISLNFNNLTLFKWLLISSQVQISLQLYLLYLQTFSLSQSPLQHLNHLCLTK